MIAYMEDVPKPAPMREFTFMDSHADILNKLLLMTIKLYLQNDIIKNVAKSARYRMCDTE